MDGTRVRGDVKHRAILTAQPASILILRALHLGDLLCSVPAWRALREAFPSAKVTLAGLPWARQFVARFGRLLDSFIEFPGYPGLPEREADPPAVLRFLAEVQAARYDVVLQMHGSGSIMNPLAALFGGGCLAGFYVPGAYCPDPARFMRYPEEEPEVLRHARLMEFLGIPVRDCALEFPVTANDEKSLADIGLGSLLVPGRYIVVHPGARAADRRWDPSSFARTAAAVASGELAIIVTGSASESSLTCQVASALHGAVDLAGRTDLGALAVLLRGARLLLSNDTGVSHLAAALQVPSVVVFSGSEMARWRPLDSRRHRAVAAAEGEGAVVREAMALLEGCEREYAA